MFKMLKSFNVLLIIFISLLYPQSHTKEISQENESPTSSIEEIAEEMVDLNASLDSLNHRISNLLPSNSI